MHFVRGLLASFLALLLAGCALGAPRPPVAAQGRLHLAAGTQQVLPLLGEWGFAWHQFVDPTWEALPTRAFASVPSSWNGLVADGKPAGENGWGSYVLLVDCPRGQQLAVEAIGQRTASRLYVNGTLVAAHGRAGPTAQQNWAAIHHRVPITHEFACPLRLTLHIANFDHRSGGFVRPMMLGPADLLHLQRESRVLYDAALLSAYLLTGLVALIFFAVRRQERTALVFGLFCIAMAVYSDMIGERLLLRPLPPQVGWRGYMQVEYLSWIAAMALFLATLRGLFPAEIHRGVVRGVLATLGLAAVAVMVLPPGIYSYVALPGQAISVVVAAYVAAAMIRAQRRTPVDARVLLAGMVAVFAGLVADLLLIDVPGPDRKFAPIGFALFLLSPAVVLARRMSAALNAEERSLALQENARLREDVERMSRHDLKTPLNSIVGAARLLQDERLNPSQRELLGILQRAALRMLEMVNLSLGLFRMETGSYDFHPQAVDLRELTMRVLVDLHSYAEASAVTLHLQGSDRSPLPVRAEELLCYSILANLVKNAVEAAGPGQRVTIALLPGDPVVLSVHNPGVVPPTIAARFFEKYVTGKSGGTGLGTYSARLMARVQQGELALHTGPQGTTLTLRLRPLKDEAPPRAPDAPPAAPASQWLDDLPLREVLLVDDDELTRLVTRRFLPAPPFRVETASNGQAATEAMGRRWPYYLLLDMEMPVMDGLATVRWARAQEAAQDRPRCRIVMMSGNDDAASAGRAREAGADRFLVKPVSRDTLLSTLRDLEDLPGAAPAATVVPASPAAEAGLLDAASTPADEHVVVDPEWVEFFPDFMQVQRETLEAMAQALADGDRALVRFLAHRATGGLATMGLHWAARQSRAVERDALAAPPQALERRIAALREHLGKVRAEPA